MRINNVLKILSGHLKGYVSGDVDLENIGINNDTSTSGRILVSLVKISEERTLRNGKYAKVNENFKTVYKNRPVFTNLHVLFTCNHKDYNLALDKLSEIIEFFQGENVFTHLGGQNGGAAEKEKFKLIVELENLSFEQTNFMWSFLGGKQLPSVLYKVRMIPLEAVDKQKGEGKPILEVNINGNTNY